MLGCTDSTALNYQPAATDDDSGCVPYLPPVIGCMDPSATNFDSTATEQAASGSGQVCRYPVVGCTDSSAINYLSTATTDSGCIAAAPGCISPTASNFDSNANTDDGSCRYDVDGCTDSQALNYNLIATTNDGSCIPVVEGCTAPTATNYDSLANVLSECVFPITGCTNPDAVNYNAAATLDDSSCIVIGCMDSTGLNYAPAATSQAGTPCIYSPEGCTDSRALNFVSVASINDGSCISLGCTSSSSLNYDSAATTDDGTCVPIVEGCVDSAASNYNGNANLFNDGVCRYAGCTDSDAFNFDSSAHFEDGSCILPTPGCTNSRAVNFAPSAQADDGSCVVFGCTDSTKIGFDTMANANDGSCITPNFLCLDPTAANYPDISAIPAEQLLALVSDASLCIFPGCVDSMATNYNPLATEDDLSCSYTRVQATITSFGYLTECFVYVDTNGDRAPQEGEPVDVSDNVGYFSTIFKTPNLVLVPPVSMPPSFLDVSGNTCKDSITGTELAVPLATTVDASVVTPLTSIAVLLQQNFNLSSDDASETIWQSLALAPQSVWTFNALFTALTSDVPFQLVDALWLLRQMQVMRAMEAITSYFASEVDPTTAGLAGYSALAQMMQEGHVDLSNVGNLTRQLYLTSVLLDAAYTESTAQANAEQTADVNENFEVIIRAQASDRRHRQLQAAVRSHPARCVRA